MYAEKGIVGRHVGMVRRRHLQSTYVGIRFRVQKVFWGFVLPSEPPRVVWGRLVLTLVPDLVGLSQHHHLCVCMCGFRTGVSVSTVTHSVETSPRDTGTTVTTLGS